jgi:sporulation protein YlmC with PRC-barrel domain
VAGDPVSWLLIEPGWTVLGADGEKVGKVKEVLADAQTDIFHGLLLSGGREVDADGIGEIHEGHVHLLA